MADVSDPELAATIDLVRSDSDDLDWVAMGYEGKNQIVVKGKGTGGHSEMCAFCQDDQVYFILLRLLDGDQESKRVKFVFITFVGDAVSGLTRGRVGSHMSSIKPLLGQFNCEFRADNVNEMSMAIIKKKLKVAGGADYDTGSNAAGYKSSGNIKEKALKTYLEKEKETTIGGVVYVTSALPKETPVDLNGRPTVAPSTEAKKNINMELKKEKPKSPNLSAASRNRPTKAKVSTTTAAAAASPPTTAKTTASPKPAAAAAKPKPAAATKPEVKAETKPAAAKPAPVKKPEPEPEPAKAEEAEPASPSKTDGFDDLSLVEDPEERARIRAERRKEKKEAAARKAQEEVAKLRASIYEAGNDEEKATEEDDKPAAAAAAAAAEEEEEKEQQQEEQEEEQEQAKAKPEPAKTKKSLFADDDDDDDELFKPKTAAAAASKSEEVVPSVLDNEPLEVTFGAVRRFLAKHKIPFSGTPQELAELINDA